jgi:hypothetical protein
MRREQMLTLYFPGLAGHHCGFTVLRLARARRVPAAGRRRTELRVRNLDKVYDMLAGRVTARVVFQP